MAPAGSTAPTGGLRPRIDHLLLTLEQPTLAEREPVLGDLHDALLALLVGGTAAGSLRQACVEDCRRVAHIHLLVETLTRSLELDRAAAAKEEEDEPRLVALAAACAEAERVLREAGLSESLAEAQGREPDALRRATAEAVVEDRGVAPAQQPLPPATTSEGDETTQDLFEQLDPSTEAFSSAVASEAPDRLFDWYDVDHNQLLEGLELEKAIADLATYVLRKAEARAARFGRRRLAPPRALVEQWVREVVDPESSSSITREEAKAGFKKVVDDVGGATSEPLPGLCSTLGVVAAETDTVHRRKLAAA